MNWAKDSPTDFGLLDAEQGATEYRVTRDPLSGIWYAYDGPRCIASHSDSRDYCMDICERNYAAERSGASKFKPKNPRGRYSEGRVEC